MKFQFFLSILVIVTAGVFAAPDFVDSYSVRPAVPVPGESFEISLRGWWPDPCYIGDLKSTVIDNKIYLDLTVIPSTRPCIQVTSSWTKSVKIIGQKKGLYPIYLRYVSIISEYNTKYEYLGYAPVGLGRILKCAISDDYKSTLVRSGGFAGWIETFPVKGTYTFITAYGDSSGWLTDVDLFAVTDRGTRQIDIGGLFGLTEEPACFEKFTYSGISYYGGVESKVNMDFDPTKSGLLLGGSVIPNGADMYMYELDTHADIVDHSACARYVAADLNKDCRVNIKDLAIMASQWLECHLVHQEDCWD